MQIAILQKLDKELNKNIESEPQVLYILAEIRKYIEGYEPNNRTNYQNLYFFCNWVLHTKLTYPSSRQYLQKLENNLGNISSKNEKDITKEFINKNGSFYLFLDLRKELNDFINSHSLPNKLVSSDKNWYKFVFHLFQILMDCPVINTNGKITKFSFEESNKQICFRLGLKSYRGSVKVILKKETSKIMKIFH